LELVLPEAAELADLPSVLLKPDRLPSLWSKDGGISFDALCSYFSGENVVQVDKGGYQEPMSIPSAPTELLESAVGEAVESGFLWLLAGPASIWKEPIPAGVLTPKAELLTPPESIPATGVLKESLPEAWKGDETTAIAIYNSLTNQCGKALPWTLVRSGIDDALRGHYLERTEDSGSWPCELAGATAVKLRVPQGAPAPPPPGPEQKPGTKRAAGSLKPNELQDLADEIGEISKLCAGFGLDVHVRIEVGADGPLDDETVDQINERLADIGGEDFELR